MSTLKSCRFRLLIPMTRASSATARSISAWFATWQIDSQASHRNHTQSQHQIRGQNDRQTRPAAAVASGRAAARRRTDLDERLHLELARDGHEPGELGVGEDGHDEQHRVRAPEPRLPELVRRGHVSGVRRPLAVAGACGDGGRGAPGTR
jgi:hypothetical protein